MKVEYTARKYDGDDTHSWAVFRKDHLQKGHRGIVFSDEARPVISGLSRSEASYHKKQLESWAHAK